MSKQILSIEELRERATQIIEIPDFEGEGTINVRVQKPQLMKLAGQGKIPNHLMTVAVSMINEEPVKNAKKMNDKDKMRIAKETMELICLACLVEPTYEEFIDIMTDDQKGMVFAWGTNQVSELDNFRNDSTDGENDKNGEEIQPETEPGDGDSKQ